MYSLMYCTDSGEYYVCKSNNVIQEEDGICLVAFRARLIVSHNSKSDLHDLQNSLDEGLVHLVNGVDKKVDLDLLEELLRAKAEGICQSESDNANSTLFEEENVTGQDSTKDESESELTENTSTNDEEAEIASNISVINLTAEQKSSNTSTKHKSNKKKYFCCLCKKLSTSFIKHLTRIHRDEEEVKQFIGLPTGSLERRKHLRRLKMNFSGQFKIRKTHFQHNKMNLSERHTRDGLHIKISSHLRSTVFSKLSNKFAGVICNDALMVLFGNLQCERQNDIQVRTQLRILASVLTEMKMHNSEITDLSSVFTPENRSVFDSLQHRTKSSLHIRHLYKFGRFLMDHCISKKEIEKKNRVEEFIKFLFKTKKAANAKRKNKHNLSTYEIKNEVLDHLTRKIHVPMIFKNETEILREEENIVCEDSDESLKTSTAENILNINVQNCNVNDETDKRHQNQHYPFRKRSCNYEKIIQELQHNEIDIMNEDQEGNQKQTCVKSAKKRLFPCCFCKKVYSNRLAVHLGSKHSEEEEVRKFLLLPKGSVERRKIIAEIVKKGKADSNISLGLTTEESVKSKIPRQKNKQNEVKLKRTKNINNVCEVEDASLNKSLSDVVTNINITKTNTNRNNDIIVTDENIYQTSTEYLPENFCEEFKDQEKPCVEFKNEEHFDEDFKDQENLTFATTNIKFEDLGDTKLSLWCMLQGHVNCSRT